MSSIEDLARQVAELQERLTQEAGLRASQDHDLADIGQSLQAANALIQALAITQGQHTGKLQRIEDKLNRLERTANETAAGVRTVISMLDALIEQGGGATE